MKIFLSTALLIGAILSANADQAVITSGPQDLKINAGSTADFIVTATNATSYQWAFQGAGMLQATNISGATNAELNFSDVSTNQAGVYAVTVGSTGTNVTQSATLTVLQGTIVKFQISGFASGPSNIVVELFDHDKPATVQNFIHYIISGFYSNTFVPGDYARTYSTGAYSNMFIDRLIPGFVLQGGGYFAGNRTNSIPIPAAGLGDINQIYVLDRQVTHPDLPQQVDSEFYVGPKVSNTRGTIAMALPGSKVDGATSDFFFNLVDNAFLDVFTNGGGPYTVFGRVLSGAEVLDYFNNPQVFSKPAFTVTPTENIFTNGIYDFALQNYSVLTDLPVNFHGTNVPGYSNLFFLDFSFPVAGAQPVIDTNPPSSAITFPAANAMLTNGTALTVLGTAQDDVGLARVFCSLAPLNGANGGLAGGDNATGATNWSLFFGVVQPGLFNIIVTPQDGAGNLGTLISQGLVVTAVLTNGVGSVVATNLSTGAVIGNAVGANLAYGTDYELGAQPGPGQAFFNWTYGTNVSTNRNLSIQMTNNMVWTANFTSNGLIFTAPMGGYTTNGTFSIAGAILAGLLTPPVTVTCRLYSSTNQQLLSSRQVTATNNWSFAFTNLALGHYYAVVTALDAVGVSIANTNDFTAGLPMTVLANGNGRGTISPNYNGQFLVAGKSYSMTATAAAGSLFDTWSDGVNYTNSPKVNFKVTPGATLTATFVSNNFPASIATPIAFTYPASLAKLTNPTFNLAGTLNPALTSSLNPAITNPVISYQLFYGSNSVTPPSTNVTIVPGIAPARTTWWAGLTNLAPGYYTVVATVSDSKGRSTLIKESFQVLAQLVLQVNPVGAGAISSNWTTGQFVSVGVPYSVKATAHAGFTFSNWSNATGDYANNPLTFSVAANQTMIANFATNYFYYVAGTYYGLFTNGAISPTNSGYFTLTVTSNAALSLSLYFPGKKLSSTGYFYPAGYVGNYATAAFYWTGLDGKFVTNDVYLDLTGGAYFLFGDVRNAGFSSSLYAFRGATNLKGSSAAMPGTNVFSIPGDHTATNNHPGGDGYGSLTLGANGVVNVIGYLADNTSFSQSTYVSTNFLNTNGIWPFYAPLYSGKGIVIGWVTNTSPTNFEGAVAWSKPAKTGAYYTNAFVFLTNSSSASFIPPANGTHYQIAFGGASLTNGLTNTLTVATTGQFTVDAGQTNKLALTLNLKSGVLTGSFSYPTAKITHNLYGAFANPSQGGSGYFLDTNSETGWIEITPR